MTYKMSAYSRWVRNISSPSERPGEAFNFIGGGVNNQVLGSCSAILGGSGNNDGGLPYVGIFGCNITGAVACTFHANNYFINNACLVSAGGHGTLPAGSVYVDDVHFGTYKVLLMV